MPASTRTADQRSRLWRRPQSEARSGIGVIKRVRVLEAKVTHEARRLFTTFAFLVAKQGATAGIGIIYWVVATRFFDAREVGLAAAAASTAMLLAAFGALGVPLLLLAEIERMDPAERRAIFTTGLAVRDVRCADRRRSSPYSCRRGSARASTSSVVIRSRPRSSWWARWRHWPD